MGKLTDRQWEDLFAREARGERRGDLAEVYGVSERAIRNQAAKRGVATDRRRRPPGGWPEDQVVGRAGMSRARWRELLARWHAGERDVDLAEDYGVSVGSIHRVARELGVRKRDCPEAVRKRTPWPRPSRDPQVRAACRFEAVAGDVGGSLEALDVTRAKAAAQGVIEAVELLSRTEEAMCRAAAQRRKLEAAGTEAGRAPSTGYAGPPPPQAGEDQARLVLHPHQRPPTRAEDGGDWSTWLVLGGRGAGKTLAGAAWVAAQALRLGDGGRIALVGATIHDVREVMIGGPSGLMSLGVWGETRPVYAPSRRRVLFPGGCEGWVFSAEEPDRLRGPQFHCGWADEFCAWKPGSGTQDALAMLRLGLRLRGLRPAQRGPCTPSGSPSPSEGDGEETFGPQLVITTTPRPTRALKRLMAEPGVAVTRAGTAANAAHLAPGFVAGLTALYGGTRLAAQEIDGQVVDDGLALFSAEMMAGCRGARPAARFERVVVGVDPCVTAGGHACGIVVVGRAGGRAFVLADRTVKGVSPESWARAAVAAARDHGAAGLVVEVNQGGELVTGLLRAIGGGAEVRPVRASVGKRARAEPVAALYEQGRVIHVGVGLEALEEELMGIGEEAGDLDRADALVWAVSELLLGEPGATPRVSAAGPEPRPWGLARGSETDLSAPGPWPRLR